MQKTKLYKSIMLAISLTAGASLITACGGDKSSSPKPSGGVSHGGSQPIAAFKDYEIWATDQSNSKAGATGIGTQGSSMWIWKASDIAAAQKDVAASKSKALGCGTDANIAGKGPCQIEDVFPGTLTDEAGTTLSSKFGAGFARMHGSLSDPQGKYMNINMFLTGGSGGFVGLMDAQTKEAVALWQVTKTGKSAGGRSVHMSFWNKEGSALFIANLHGRIMERVDITRDMSGKITKAVLNRAAAFSAGAGTSAKPTEDSHAYSGKNALGNDLISEVSGAYDLAAGFSNVTPNGICKENNTNKLTDHDNDPLTPDVPLANSGLCADDTIASGAKGGRPGGVIICPIVSNTGMGYLTFGAGGMLVIDTNSTPMKVVAEYGNNEVNGAGCGGVHAGNNIWLDGGVSATGKGADRSTFVVYTVNDTIISEAAKSGAKLPENFPPINTVFKDAGNTSASGNIDAAPGTVNNTGQLPGTTTRRDGHGMIATIDNKYVHVVDRIQNTMDVFSTATLKSVGKYSLTTADGKMGGTGKGACEAVSVKDASSVSDGVALPTNDPAPDLMGVTPDGRYIVVALRGAKPVTVNHGGQGSCPGVGLIELTDGGKSGKLSGVLRSTNTTDDAVPPKFSGGANYNGTEASDIHGAWVRVIK